jgi:hypothetical protein
MFWHAGVVKHRTLAALALVAIPLTTPLARAWDDYGHEIVASVAYQDLKPEAKARVNALLHQHVQYTALAAGCPEGFDKDQWVFMRAATWPDMVRATSNPCHATDHHSKWHYINIPIEIDGAHGPQPRMEWTPSTDPENAVQALARAETSLKNTNVPESDKAKDLCWFLHVGGDLHQPLHATALFSKDFPKGDQGGNLFWVATGLGSTVKLHALWDQSLGTLKDPKAAAKRAGELVKETGLTRKALAEKVAKTSYVDWATESAGLSRTVVYDDGRLKGSKVEEKEHAPKDAPVIPEGYAARMAKVSEERVVLAGYRLADKLNQCVASAPATTK